MNQWVSNPLIVTTPRPPLQAIELGGGSYLVGHHLSDYDLIHLAIDQLYIA